MGYTLDISGILYDFMIFYGEHNFQPVASFWTTVVEGMLYVFSPMSKLSTAEGSHGKSIANLKRPLHEEIGLSENRLP